MFFKPRLFSLKAINLYFLFLTYFAVIFFPILVLSQANIFISTLGTILGIIVSFKFSISHLFEKIDISDKYMSFKEPFKPSQIFNLDKIKSIQVLSFYSKLGYAYVFLFDKKITNQKSIQLTTKNSFVLRLAWSGNDASEILKCIPDKDNITYKNITGKHKYIISGKALKLLTFNFW